MPALPSGTVTFVFTDIEGSTALLKQLGERYGDALSAHRRIVRETFAAANGIEIDKQGDAFFFAFPRARDAVGAAVEVQRAHAAKAWPDGAIVRLRIGLHTGEPVVGDEGYLGLDVVRAARLCTVGRGGHILLSEATRSLIGSALPDGVSVFPLGERQLRGIDEPERVYELAIEGVEVEDVEEPAPAAPSDPSPASREQEIERRFEELGTRVAAGIQERVFRSLEDVLAKAETLVPTPAREDADVEDLAARAASLEEKIRNRVEATLKAKGISRGGSWLMPTHSPLASAVGHCAEQMDSEKARELLRRERDRIERALAQLSVPGGEELAGQDEMADAASQLYEEEFDEGQADDLRAELAAVKHAEERLAAGTYGISVESGEPIPDERLEAVPTAERTVEEQERFDHQASLRADSARMAGDLTSDLA